MKTVYEAEVQATGDGRGGDVKATDGSFGASLSVPEGVGGPGGDGTNPEQLFAAGYAACFHGAFRLVASQAKVDVTGSSVTARVRLNKGTDGLGLGATLTVSVPGVDRAVVQELTEKAHTVCPYSKATRGNIDVELVVAG